MKQGPSKAFKDSISPLSRNFGKDGFFRNDMGSQFQPLEPPSPFKSRITFVSPLLQALDPTLTQAPLPSLITYSDLKCRKNALEGASRSVNDYCGAKDVARGLMASAAVNARTLGVSTGVRGACGVWAGCMRARIYRNARTRARLGYE